MITKLTNKLINLSFNSSAKNNDRQNQHPSIVSMNTRSHESLCLNSVLPPMTPMTMTTHRLSNQFLPLSPITRNPYIINKMLKEQIGISNYLEGVSLRARPKAGTKELGLGTAVNVLYTGESSGTKNSLTIGRSSKLVNKDSPSSSSWQPVGLGVGLPPLLKKESVDFVISLIPLFIVSFIYLKSYPVGGTSDITSLLPAVQETSVRGTSDITSLVPAVQETSIEVQNGSELQQVISNQQDFQLLRLLGLVAGIVAVGAVVFWVAYNGAR